MQHVTIESATLAELPAMHSLLNLLFDQDQAAQAELVLQQRSLTVILQHANVGEIFIARQEGTVVGMISVLYSFATAPSAGIALLDNLITDPRCSGKGISLELVQTAVVHAKQRGCQRVSLLTDSIKSTALQSSEKLSKQGTMTNNMLPLSAILKD